MTRQVWVAVLTYEPSDDPIIAVYATEEAADRATKEARRIQTNWIRRGWTDPQPDAHTRWLNRAAIIPCDVTE